MDVQALHANIFPPAADLQPLIAAFDANEPAGLHLGPLPVLIVQGGVDFAVFPFLTDVVVQSLRDNGATQLTYLTYPEQDHNGRGGGIVARRRTVGRRRLAEHPVPTTTTSTTVPPSSTTTPATTTGASVIAVTATSPTPTAATGTLPATGIEENALWVETIAALVLVRIGWFCVSLTKPPRARRAERRANHRT